jgi:hypothetical protein
MPSLILAARSRTPEWHSATWCVSAQQDGGPKEEVRLLGITVHRRPTPLRSTLCQDRRRDEQGVLFHKLIAVTEIGGTEDSS